MRGEAYLLVLTKGLWLRRKDEQWTWRGGCLSLSLIFDIYKTRQLPVGGENSGGSQQVGTEGVRERRWRRAPRNNKAH